MTNMFASVFRASRVVVGFSLFVVAMAASASATFEVPEIDPASIGSALTLLASGAFLISGKARKS